MQEKENNNYQTVEFSDNCFKILDENGQVVGRFTKLGERFMTIGDYKYFQTRKEAEAAAIAYFKANQLQIQVNQLATN